jgi:hypothetical protein
MHIERLNGDSSRVQSTAQSSGGKRHFRLREGGSQFHRGDRHFGTLGICTLWDIATITMKAEGGGGAMLMTATGCHIFYS